MPTPSEPRRFARIVTDPGVFEFGGCNLFKVYQARFALDRRRAGWKVGGRRAAAGLLASRVRLLVRGLAALGRLALAGRREPRTVFYGASGRLSPVDGVTYDLYNGRIVEELGRERCVILEDGDDGAEKRFRPDLRLGDFALAINVLAAVYRLLLGGRLRRFAARAAAAYPELGWDARAIRGMAAAFFANALVVRTVLALLRPGRALMICHYGREPFIAACRRLRVPVTELMHGAIVGDDTFYRYPEAYAGLFARSFFPDRLGVYGEYWRRIVLGGRMFPPEAVTVVGYYLKVPPRRANGGVRGRRTQDAGRNRILITTQPTAQAEFAAYLAFLKAALGRDEWLIVVKPHPAEDPAAYRALAERGFVEVSGRSTYELLAECDVHISAYSTVLYEAVFYGAANYALYVARYAAQWSDVVASGAAAALLPDQLPALGARGAAGGAAADAAFYLADFDLDAVL